ncbi:MAG: flagellar motor switch protein FliM [Terriglobales bacterium]
MERSLSQDEIDALFRRARGLAAGTTRRQRDLARCDFRQAGQITREQARAVGSLHEGFARNLGHTLGAYLRSQLDASLVAIEQLSFGECMQRLPDISYVASVAVAPLGISAAVQLDMVLAYPMIDLVLGGNGVDAQTPTELTEIEEQILESIVAIITRELQQVWQPVVEVSFEFERRQPTAQALRLMPPSEKVLALSFELQLAGQRGMMSVALPAVVANSLLRQLSDSWVYHRRQEDPETQPRLRERLQDARFALELALPPFRASIRQLMDLHVGEVLLTRHRLERPAQLLVAGRHAFQAQPIRQHNCRAALIEAAQPITKPEGGL